MHWIQMETPIKNCKRCGESEVDVDLEWDPKLCIWRCKSENNLCQVPVNPTQVQRGGK